MVHLILLSCNLHPLMNFILKLGSKRWLVIAIVNPENVTGTINAELKHLYHPENGAI